MYVLNEDTIWLADPGSLTGGVFRTTNGGGSWVQQASFSVNPDKIYFYNARIGYIGNVDVHYIRKTTDAGATWNLIVSNESFKDIYFIDSLTGWRAYAGMNKTTDGGISWINQPMPPIIGGITELTKFSVLNKDTIWGVGGAAQYPNLQVRGVIYTTTNGGSNWFYQVPDTTIRLPEYTNIEFINKL